MTPVKGRDVDIYIIDGVPVFTGCATNMSLEVTADEIAKTTVNSGRNREVEGGLISGTGSFDGLITLDMLGRFQYDDFVQAVGTVLTLLVKFTNDYGDVLSYQFSALIKTVSAQGDVNDFGSFSVGFTRSGAFTRIFTLNGGLIDSFGNYIIDSDGEIIRA